jgi:hypothetical protein
MSGTLNLRYRAEPQKINLFDEIRFPKSCYCAFASASMSGFCVAAHHIDGGLMPLTRSKEQILTTMNGVNFLMEDGPTEVPCTATRELLGTGSEAMATLTKMKAFRLNRAAMTSIRALRAH